MALRLGDTVPNFTQSSTEGEINFTTGPETAGLLFSTQRLYSRLHHRTAVGLASEFDKRNVKVLALSVDDVNSHKGWVGDIEETQTVGLNYLSWQTRIKGF